jgi:toxin secretion/phage lysis holin
MDNIKKVQAVLIGVLAAVNGFLGNLAVPVYVLLACNVIDYITALIAAPKRGEQIDSLKGFQGLKKKVLMYLLIAVGWLIDTLVNYAAQQVRPDFRQPYIVAVVVALWLAFNEMLSIIENVADADGPVPPFLRKLIKNLKKKTEDVTETGGDDERK